jgi:hypothetical protein
MKDPIEALEGQLEEAEGVVKYLQATNTKHVKTIIALRFEIIDLETQIAKLKPGEEMV